MEPEQSTEQPEPTQDETPSQSPPDLRRYAAGKSRKHWLRWVIIVLVVLLLAAGVLYALKVRHNPVSKQSPNSSTTSSGGSQQAANEPTVPTKSYTSNTFSLSFNYPEQWQVHDTGMPPLTVTSTPMTLKDASGQQVTGEVVVTIQQQGQLPKDFSGGDAVAVLDSQKINYSHPTSDQRAQTYLSFLQYAATTTHGALDGIYVTGNLGYKRLQPVPSTDITPRDPLVYVVFVKCANSTCSGTTTPLSIASDDWSDPNFRAPIKTLITSLSIQ